jgi:hypothetical protein
MTASGILPMTSHRGGLFALDRLNPHERSFFVVLLSTEKSRTFNPESVRHFRVSASLLRPKNICGSEPFAGPLACGA